MSGADDHTTPRGPEGADDPGPASRWRLPIVRTTRSRDEVLGALESASRRGKLPGFARGTGPVLFRVDAFGHPFEYRLEALAEQGTNGELTLRFRPVMASRVPMIFAAVIAVTIWPGVWVTDSMLRTYFSWYEYATWMWYLPLTIVPVPLMLRGMIRRSRAESHAAAMDLIDRVRGLVGETGGPG